MKLTKSNRRTNAMTLIEVLVVVVIIGLLIAIFLPALMAPKIHHSMINCPSNLKQIGIAALIWAGDNNGKYPMQVSITNGGAMEFGAAGNAAAVFQVMSNELSTPKVMICPADTAHFMAPEFSINFGSTNVSYFAGLDAATNYPHAILAGDDNLVANEVPMKSGVRTLSEKIPLAWTAERHHFNGNILLTDGSVAYTSDSDLIRAVTNQYADSSGFTNRFRIVIP